jgi:hypothetical protein
LHELHIEGGGTLGGTSSLDRSATANFGKAKQVPNVPKIIFFF